MKRVLRSLYWDDDSEKSEATANYKQIRKERFLSPKKAEIAILSFQLDYYAQYGEAPAYRSIFDYFEGRNQVEEISLLEETRGVIPYPGPSFEHLVEEVVETQATDDLRLTCQQALKIATVGLTTKSRTLRGSDEAVNFLFGSLKQKPPKAGDVMSANLRKSADPLRELYRKRKANPQQTYGVLTGYGLIDSSTAGIRRKNLYVHAGFYGHLKSTHMLNMVLNAAEAGWNPLVFTSEMPAEDVKLLLISIHSGHPKFNGTGRPLSAFRLLLGALNSQEEAFFDMVMDDLNRNPDHGLIRVVDSGDFTSWGSIMQRTTREDQEEEVDILWVDYLTRLPLDAKYEKMSITEARNETIADAKRFAMSFKKGVGLAVCTPFQVNREGWKRAKDNGGKVDKTSMAQYNAIEREGDVISYIWYDEEEKVTCEPLCGLLKSRWGDVPNDPTKLFIEIDSRRIFDLSSGMTSPGIAPTKSSNKGEDEVVL